MRASMYRPLQFGNNSRLAVRAEGRPQHAECRDTAAHLTIHRTKLRLFRGY
jgi:hypothetical protein